MIRKCEDIERKSLLTRLKDLFYKVGSVEEQHECPACYKTYWARPRNIPKRFYRVLHDYSGQGELEQWTTATLQQHETVQAPRTSEGSVRITRTWTTRRTRVLLQRCERTKRPKEVNGRRAFERMIKKIVHRIVEAARQVLLERSLETSNEQWCKYCRTRTIAWNVQWTVMQVLQNIANDWTKQIPTCNEWIVHWRKHSKQQQERTLQIVTPNSQYIRTMEATCNEQ
jgi:hypothetical protein